MSSRYKNSGNDRPKNTGFNLKRILYLMAHSQIVSSKSHGDDSWQRSLCYSNKNFNSFPRDMLLLYRRMAAVFESHWTRIQTLTIYQGIERNVSFMIPALSNHCELRFQKSQKPIIYLCCGGKDMVALDWLPFIAKFFQSHPNETNTSFLLVEYPGYGFNMGTATPRTCTDIALQTMKKGLEMYPNKDVTVKFLGYSLGAAVLLDSANIIYSYIHSGNTDKYSSNMKPRQFSLAKYNVTNITNFRDQRHLSRLCKIKTKIPQVLPNKNRIMPFSSVRDSCHPKPRSNRAGVFVRIKRKLRFHRARVAINSRRWLRRPVTPHVIGKWLKRINLQQMILIAPFTSTAECVAAYLKVPSILRSFSAHLFSFFQNDSTKYNNRSVVRRLFENLSKFKQKFKLIVFHGDKDKIVPCYMGQQIIDEAALWPNVHKCTNETCPPWPLHAKMCIIPGADHTTICSNSEHLDYIFKAMCIHSDPNEIFDRISH